MRRGADGMIAAFWTAAASGGRRSLARRRFMEAAPTVSALGKHSGYVARQWWFAGLLHNRCRHFATISCRPAGMRHKSLIPASSSARRRGLMRQGIRSRKAALCHSGPYCKFSRRRSARRIAIEACSQLQHSFAGNWRRGPYSRTTTTLLLIPRLLRGAEQSGTEKRRRRCALPAHSKEASNAVCSTL
jgi:hypothetical protein